MTQYAHIIKKDNAILAIYNNQVENGNELLRAHPAGSTNTTVNHLDTTITYELVDGNITPVTMENIYARMNDPDDTSVQIPTD